MPREVEAIARVDIQRMAAADPAFAALLPSTLQKQRPELLALLAAGGVNLVGDIERVILALGKDFGKSGAYLVGMTGSFDEARLERALASAKLSRTLIAGLPMYTFRTREGTAAIVVVRGLLVAGALPLVERSAKLIAEVGAAAPPNDDVRVSLLAEELKQIDPEAHLIAAAALGDVSRQGLASEVEGLTRLRLEVTRVQGRAQVALRMNFDSARTVGAARARVAALMEGAQVISPALGLLKQFLDPTMELRVEGTALIARAVF